jgi:hypothetical protein
MHIQTSCIFFEFSNTDDRKVNAFTSMDRGEHGSRRKRTAALYAKSALLRSAQMHNISANVMYDRLVPRLSAAAAKDTEIDMLELSYCICSDYISAFLYGYRNGTNFLTGDKDKKAITEWRRNYEDHMAEECFWPQEMPLVNNIMKSIGINMMPKSYIQSKKWLEKWLGDMAIKADKTIYERTEKDLELLPEDLPIVYEATKVAVQKDSPHLDSESQRGEVASEMFDHICKFTLRTYK